MYHWHLEALMPEVPVYIENATTAEETNSGSVSSALLSCASFFFFLPKMQLSTTSNDLKS